MKRAFIIQTNIEGDPAAVAAELYEVLLANTDIDVVSVEPFAEKKRGLKPSVWPAAPGGTVE